MTATTRIALQLILLPLLAVALFFVHGYALAIATEIGILPHSRPLELAGLLASSVLGAGLTAALFSYPLARAYGPYAALAAFLVCAPTLLFRAPYMFQTSGRPFVIATLALEVVALAVLVPYGAWLLHRMRSNNSFKPKPLRGSA